MTEALIACDCLVKDRYTYFANNCKEVIGLNNHKCRALPNPRQSIYQRNIQLRECSLWSRQTNPFTIIPCSGACMNMSSLFLPILLTIWPKSITEGNIRYSVRFNMRLLINPSNLCFRTIHEPIKKQLIGEPMIKFNRHM